MLKFLRRYTKHLLVGVTILILVSWLLGSTLTEMLAPDESNEVIARAFGETNSPYPRAASAGAANASTAFSPHEPPA